MKLSIIIPYYNTKDMTEELLDALVPQLTDDTEVIVVDDGSRVPFKTKHKVKIIRKENGGVASARNVGLSNADGSYLAFIDSDDLITEDYIKLILVAISSEPDTVYLSWRSLDRRLGKIIESEEDEFNPWNRCIWNRVFKKEWLNGLRFNEELMVAEDDDFLKRKKDSPKKIIKHKNK